jgi:hypothetical protein
MRQVVFICGVFRVEARTRYLGFFPIDILVQPDQLRRF